MVTTRFQAKRRRLDMDSAIGRSEDENQNGGGHPQEVDEATGDTHKMARTSGLPPSSKGAVVRSGSPLGFCRRLIGKRAKKNSFCAFNPRQKNNTISTAHNCISLESHDTFLHVGPMGEKIEGRRHSTSSIGHDYFRFRCPLGDIWHDAYADVCRHRTVKTGDVWIDRALRSIPFQGFDITHFVGTGKFSYVLAGSCNQKFPGMVAVKILRRDSPKSSSSLKTIAPWHVDYPREVVIHRSLHHPNIVRWLDYMTYMQRKCIITEFCHLGGLNELLNATCGKIMTEQVAKIYFTQMVSAVEYIHSKGIVHRDLVVSNWVVDRLNVPKLIDFGSARFWSSEQPLLTDLPGTDRAYMAPEALFGEPYNPRLADIWSLGVVLFKIVTSAFPFGNEPSFQPGVLTTLPYPNDNILNLSLVLKDLLNNILHPHILLRFTLNRIKQSQWFTEYTSDKFYVTNHYLGRQPLKIREGALERRWKQSAGLIKPEIVHKAWVPQRTKIRVVRLMKVRKVGGLEDGRPNSALAIGAESYRIQSLRENLEESETGQPHVTVSVSNMARSNEQDAESSSCQENDVELIGDEEDDDEDED